MRALLILITFLAFSCTERKSKKNVSINLNIEAINIEVDSLSKASYSVFSHYNHSGKLFLIGYNDNLHSLDIYNISNKKFERRIHLDLNGPKSINRIEGLYYHNKDSIFTYSRGKISLFSNNYTNFHYYNLFQIIENQNLNFEPTVNQHFRLTYHPASKSIPLQNIYYSDKKSYIADRSLLSKLNIEDNRIEKILYSHTEDFDYVDEFGHLNYSTFSTLDNGKIVVNQVYSPKTMRIDLVNNKKKYIINSNKEDFYSNQDLNNWQNHAINSTYYNQLMKIEDDKFIRVLWKGVESEINSNGFLEKDLTIQVFDNELNLLKEIQLPKNTYGVYSWFTYQKALYLQASHPLYENLNENYFEIHRITFE